MLSLRPRVELSIPVAAKHVPSGGSFATCAGRSERIGRWSFFR